MATKIEKMMAAIQAVTDQMEERQDAVAELVKAATAAVAALKRAEEKLDELAEAGQDGLTDLSVQAGHAAIDLEDAVQTVEQLS